MKRIYFWASMAVVVFSLAVTPNMAFASTTAVQPSEMGATLAAAAIADQDEAAKQLRDLASASAEQIEEQASFDSGEIVEAVANQVEASIDAVKEAKQAAKEKKDAVNKVLEYDRKLIKEIGTQEKTGHTICCPSFSCAYADAVMDGTVHDHTYYTCSCCTWTDWGGGSFDRCVGSDEELLREAYDQICKGKPTVIHVTGSTSEHWIALIGYKRAKDPDHLTLSNFIALDPWDGAQINAGSRYSLYGDGCEHISER